MNKTSNNNQIAIDKITNIVYNTDMINDNNNKGNDMSNTNEYNFRVYKAANYYGTIQYEAFANFKTVQDAVDYMKQWNPNQIHNWYIHDVDCDVKYSYNTKKQLIVTKPEFWNIDE